MVQSGAKPLSASAPVAARSDPLFYPPPGLILLFRFGICRRFQPVAPPDEIARTAFAELGLALELLSRQEQPTPVLLWSSLAPFLCDPAGNTHRSGLNIEKLWNPYLPGRGCLGLVEFRALRMVATPERSAALAALLRAIVALLSLKEEPGGLKDWGDELHERFALPYFLERDLREVLAELTAAGLGLGPAIVKQLLDDGYRFLGDVEFQGCRLGLRRALEFWPLVGDVASQEGGASRLVDASTNRIEVTLRSCAGAAEPLEHWRLQVDGYRAPLRLETDAEGPVLVTGLRYRNFVPTVGLHPSLGAHGPVALILWRDRVGRPLCGSPCTTGNLTASPTTVCRWMPPKPAGGVRNAW